MSIWLKGAISGGVCGGFPPSSEAHTPASFSYMTGPFRINSINSCICTVLSIFFTFASCNCTVVVNCP